MKGNPPCRLAGSSPLAPTIGLDPGWASHLAASAVDPQLPHVCWRANNIDKRARTGTWPQRGGPEPRSGRHPDVRIRSGWLGKL